MTRVETAAVFGIVVIAFLCGVLFIAYDADDAVPVFSRWNREKENKFGSLASLRQRLAGDELLALGAGDPEERLAFARRNPHRPWLLWHCLLAAKPFRLFPQLGERTALSKESESVRELALAFEESAEELRDCDTENGLPLLFLAYLEFRRGCAFESGSGNDGTAVRIVEPAHAENAVRLLRLAAAKKKVSDYGRERGRECISMLGPQDSMLRSVETSLLLLPAPAVSSAMIRDVAAYAVAAAGERLRHGEEKEAVAILRDLRIIGLRLIADANAFIPVALGYRLVGASANDGARALQSAGYSETAERLLRQAEDVYRPFFLIRLRRSDGKPPEDGLPFPLLAQRLLSSTAVENRASQANEARSVLENDGCGFWLSYAMSPLISAEDGTVFTLEELAASGHLERLGIARAIWTILIALCTVVLGIGGLILAASSLGMLFSGKREAQEKGDEVPKAKKAALDMVVAGCLSLFPGLLAAGLGHPPTVSGWSALGKLLFWTGWGLVCGMWYIDWRIGGMRPSEKAKRKAWFIRAGLGSLAFAVPCALCAFGEGMREYPALAAFFALLIAFVALNACRPESRGGVAHYFIILSGCLLFWIAAQPGLKDQEREWASRAVLTAHHADDPVCAAIPAEGRIVLLHSLHARRHLAKEGD